MTPFSLAKKMEGSVTLLRFNQVAIKCLELKCSQQ